MPNRAQVGAGQKVGTVGLEVGGVVVVGWTLQIREWCF